MVMAWDIDQGSSLSQFLRSGVVKWINTRLSLFLLSTYHLFPYSMLTLGIISNKRGVTVKNQLRPYIILVQGSISSLCFNELRRVHVASQRVEQSHQTQIAISSVSLGVYQWASSWTLIVNLVLLNELPIMSQWTSKSVCIWWNC